MGLRTGWLIVLFAVAVAARAQSGAAVNDTTLKGSTIEIIQAYKPQVKQAPKPGWIPQLPPVDTTRRTFNYDVPQQVLYYSYTSQPLRPLALSGDSAALPFRNYVKVGAGNLSTVYLDAGVGSISGQNYETAFHLHHISQSGALPNQQSALSGLEAEASWHREFSDWHATFSGERSQYYYYGYDHSAYHYEQDSLKQVYGLARVTIDMKNKVDSGTKWTYHPDANLSYYTAKYNTSEETFGLNLPFRYRVDSNLSMPLAFSGVVTDYKSGSVSTGNNIAELIGGVAVAQRAGINGHALLGLAMGKGGNGYLLPDVAAVYEIPGSTFVAKAGWQATLRQNTYEQLTTENPFLFHTYGVAQTRRDEVYADLHAGIGNHLSLTGRISWWGFNDLPTFLNNAGDQKDFYVDYINTNAISFYAALRFKVAEIWSLGVSADIYNYYNNGPAKVYVWGEPTATIKGDFSIRPFPKLMVTGYCALMSGIYEKDINNNPQRLDLFTDLGGNAEYTIIPRLSAFLQVSNLLNQTYQRWYQYQVYGLNVFGGLRLKF